MQVLLAPLRAFFCFDFFFANSSRNKSSLTLILLILLLARGLPSRPIRSLALLRILDDNRRLQLAGL